jgi:hypothetical protein
MMDEYAYGTLSPRRERKIRAHLAHCAACEDSLADTHLVHEAIGAWQDLPEPEDGLHRLSSRLDFAPPPAIVLRPRRFRHLVLPYVAGLATAAALLLLVGDPFRAESPVATPPSVVDDAAVADNSGLLPGERVLTDAEGPFVIVKDGQVIEVDDATRRRLLPEHRLKPRMEAVDLNYESK